MSGACSAQVRQVLEHMRVTEAASGAVDLAASHARVTEVLSNHPTLTLLEATEILTAVQATSFTLPQRGNLTQLVNSKVGAPTRSSAATAQAPRQSCDHFWEWMTDAMWDLWAQPGTTWNAILHSIVSRCDAIGLVHPSEGTLKSIWATVVMVRAGPSGEIVVDGPEAVRKKVEIGQAIAVMRGRGALLHHGVARAYPQAPTDMKTTHADVYASAYPAGFDPVPSRIHSSRIQMLCDRLPRRSTHASVAAGVRDMRARTGDYGRRPSQHRPRAADPFVPGLVIYDEPRASRQDAFQHAMLPLPMPQPHQQPNGAAPSGLL
eukprot:467669-Pyramimonas_sp.AAC.1